MLYEVITARAVVPPVAGLAEAGFLTNETVFNLTELPPRLAVIGAGPIGCELAQAFARFGSQVSVIQRGPRLLPREDGDAALLLESALARESIALRKETRVERVEVVEGGGKRLYSYNFV